MMTMPLNNISSRKITVGILLFNLILAASAGHADMVMNCAIYRDNQFITSVQKTLSQTDLRSAWANYHPDQYANNFFRQSLCESVGLGQSKQEKTVSLKGLKYHNVTVYTNGSTEPSCQIKCTPVNQQNTNINTNSNTTQANTNTIQQQEYTNTLSAAAGYITGIAIN